MSDGGDLENEETHLESVEEYVESRRDVDGTGAGVGVERVNDTEERPQESVGDTRLGRERTVVEDGSSRRLWSQQLVSGGD